MYHVNMLRINRSPDGADASGGAPAADSSPAGGAVDTSNSQAPAPEYLSKSDFETFRNELTGHLSRLTPQQQARQEAAPGEPSKPDVSKYDFQKPGELDRYNHDNYKYHRHLDRAEEAKETEAKEAKAKEEKTLQGHKSRVSDYRKENPTFDADIKAAGNIQVLNEVLTTIYSSKNSPAIVHYLAKNKAVADELNTIAESEGLGEVRERLGEIAASIKAERQALEANAEAAAAKPPRQNFSKGSKGANHEPSMEERYTRFRS